MSSTSPWIRVTLVIALSASVGCGGGGTTTPPPPPPPPPTTVETLSIQGLPTAFEVGDQVQLAVVARNADGNVVSNPALTWLSMAPAIVSVTPSTGRVTAVSVGQATIRVSGAGKAAEAVLHVMAPTATAVALLPATIALAPGANLQLQAAVLGANGTIPGLPITFSTGDPTVATVDGTGRVTAVAPGRTTVTARHGTISQLSGITVSHESQNLRVARVDLIQVAQTTAADIPPVQGKPTALRVYPVAAVPGATGVPIDVRVARNGATVFAQRIATGSVPITYDPLLDGRALYVPLPIGLDLDGVTVSARIDPDDASAEADEWDNDYPLFRDTPTAVTSLQLPQIRVRLVPMAPPGQAPPPVSPAAATQLVAFMNLIYPSVGIQVDVRPGFVTNTDWNSSAGVTQALNQLTALRTEDGSTAYYYGVTASAPINGAAGWGRNPGNVSMGWAEPEIVAHEVGHNFGLSHPVGCGNGTPGAPGAVIGLPGYDPRSESEVPSSAVSVMSYCAGYVWIQPTAYLSILNARRTAPAGLLASAMAMSNTEVAAVVMGTIQNGIVSVDQVRRSQRPRGVSSDTGPIRVRILDAHEQELLVWHLESGGLSRETGAPADVRGFAGVIPVPTHLAPHIRQLAVSSGGPETVIPFRLDPVP